MLLSNRTLGIASALAAIALALWPVCATVDRLLTERATALATIANGVKIDEDHETRLRIAEKTVTEVHADVRWLRAEWNQQFHPAAKLAAGDKMTNE